ncbi:MAG TPA: hypothetical protein VH165_22930 [Kofleriaceae bacterium]|nr:hypothetical protein [Kofleriaceae bacterium]
MALSSVANAQPSPLVVGPQPAPGVEPTAGPVPDATTAPSPPASVATAPGLTPPSGVPMAAQTLGANLGAATPGTLPAYRYYSPYATYPPPSDELVYEPSYRWQLALVDIGSVLLLFSGTDAGVTGGFAAYTFLAPTIHLAHDEGWRAAGSLGLRLGMPVLGALTGFALVSSQTRNDCSGDYDCDDTESLVTGAVVGALAGMAVAMVIDDFVIAKPRLTHKHSSLVVVPRVNVAPQQTTFGLAGSF